MNGYVPEQMRALNLHRLLGRRIVASKGTSMGVIVEIAVGTMLVIPMVIIAAHIVAGIIGGNAQ